MSDTAITQICGLITTVFTTLITAWVTIALAKYQRKNGTNKEG